MQTFESRKLNIGCGFDYRKGYVNVDLHARHNPDVVGDVLDLAMFETGYAEELVAQDVLEHVMRTDVRKALFEWNRVMAKGGTLFVRTTDVVALTRALEAPENQALADQERLLQNMFGTQAYTGDFHLAGFTERVLRFYLWEAGFDVEALSLYYGVFVDVRARKARELGFERVGEGALDEDFVRKCFIEVLARVPTAEELVAKQALAGRVALLKDLLQSDERKAQMMARAPDFPATLHRKPPLLRRVGGKLLRTLSLR